jgi:hypothetical protein
VKIEVSAEETFERKLKQIVEDTYKIPEDDKTEGFTD